MSLWFEIALVVLLALVVLVLIGIRDVLSDGIKQMGARLEGISERIDELCQPERKRQSEIRKDTLKAFEH